MAEMALEIQIERLRVIEREVKGSARIPIHISPLEERTEIDCLKAHIVGLEATVEDLRFTIHRLQRQLSIGSQPLDPPPCYQENALKVSLHSITCEFQKRSLSSSRRQQILLSKRMRLLLPQS
jgi:hypothetical protein